MLESPHFSRQYVNTSVSRLRQQKLLSKIMFAILGLAVFLFSYQLGNRFAQPDKPETSAFVLPVAMALEPFSLVDQNGETFKLQNLTDYWTLVILGDHRQESCKKFMIPYVLAWNRLAHDKQLQDMTRAAFLTLAPTASPNMELKAFIEFIHPDFVGLTGEEHEVRQFAVQLGLSEAGSNVSSCDESESIVGLIDPQGRLSALFSGISDPAIIAHDLEIIAYR